MWKENLHLACWNINGFKVKGVNKYSDPDFIKEVCNKDIICLLETHSSLQDSLNIPNFKSVHLNRPKNKKTNKISGGISVLVRSEIRQGIKFLEHSCNDYIWLQLCSKFFGCDQDIYICFLYNPPENSSYIKSLDHDLFDLIEQDILKFSKFGQIIIMGDLNARTGNDSDFIINENFDSHMPLFNNYCPDVDIFTRLSRDNTILPRGRALNDMCIQTGLRILNGRCCGDYCGNLTCHNYNGSSVVDYGIVSESLLNQVVFFSVHKFLPLFSDHCQISVMIKVYCKLNVINENLQPTPKRYRWGDDSPNLYQEALSSNNIQEKIKYIMDNKYENNDSLVDDLNSVLCEAADIALIKSSKCKKNKTIKHKPKWQDKSLFVMKKDLEQKQKLFHKYDKDPHVRGSFFSALKNYRKIRKKKIRQYYGSIVDQLDTLLENSPKKYWDLLNNLIQNKSESTCDISASSWLKYFEDLNKKPVRTSLDIYYRLKNLEDTKIFSELDNLISKKEIIDNISSLKNNKASSYDAILNEMLKYGQNFIIDILHKLFNSILSSGKFPKAWARGIVVPIFKSGIRDDPANYRGLTVGSNICKLFTKILNCRLEKYCTEKNIICKEQIGFCKGKRTSDHIFALKTLIDKYCKQGSKRLYTCFIDFRRAFDTVRHEELFYKLRKNGISDRFYTVIKDMYENINLSVKVNPNNLSTDFQSFVGVRQGDNLSPNLFKIFINDLPEIFDNRCKPVILNTTRLNCLMYADDVILVSESAEGLQNCLSRLNIYCDTWGLEVNIKKSKSMIFNNTGRLEPNVFTFNNKNLENVKKIQLSRYNF